MREFFKPRRRKIGVMTLVLACAFAAGWVRSFSISEWVIFEDVHLIITSQFGRIQWNKYGWEVSDGPIQFGSCDVRLIPPEYETSEYRNYNQEIPYALLVLPLSILSAWVLLRKPRPAKPKPATEPIPVTGESHA
jgi:hypothetical protein